MSTFKFLNHPFPISPEQQAFFQWVAEGKGSALMDAVAGAAKSSSMVESWQYIPEKLPNGKPTSVKGFAFGNTISREFDAKLTELRQRTGRAFQGWYIKTFHSEGNSAVKKHLAMPNLAPDPRKLGRLASSWLSANDYEMYGPYICKLVGYAKGEGVGALVPDDEAVWYGLAAHHDMELDSLDATEERAVELARGLLKRSNEAAKQGDIDFDDQLYLVVLWRLRLWQNDWVFVDEAQDTNPVRRAIAKLCLKPGGRLVAVGDPWQAIFGFTGASADSMDLIRKEFNCITLRLSVSFRCSKAVVAKAQKWVPHIHAAPNAIEGETPELSIRDALKYLDSHAAILCRNTAPLVSMAYALIAVGIPCHVLGREIGTGLANLIKKMKARSIDALEKKLEKYEDREVAKLTAKGQENKAQAVEDKVSCVRVLIELLTEPERGSRDAVALLLAKIDGLFQDGNSRLVLSTLHKAKGREWDTVAVLRRDLMPSRWARQEWQVLEERKLEYVCDSRAKIRTIDLTDDHEGLKKPAATWRAA